MREGMMKKFYFFSIMFSVGCILMNSLTTYAVPKPYFVAYRLFNNPDKWEIQIESGSEQLMHNYDVKNNLMQFIDWNRNRYAPYGEINYLLLMMLVFGLIGYFRERRIQKIGKANGSLQKE